MASEYEFEPQPYYHIHFRTNTLEKGTEPPYPSSYGLNSMSPITV